MRRSGISPSALHRRYVSSEMPGRYTVSCHGRWISSFLLIVALFASIAPTISRYLICRENLPLPISLVMSDMSSGDMSMPTMSMSDDLGEREASPLIPPSTPQGDAPGNTVTPMSRVTMDCMAGMAMGNSAAQTHDLAKQAAPQSSHRHGTPMPESYCPYCSLAHHLYFVVFITLLLALRFFLLRRAYLDASHDRTLRCDVPRRCRARAPPSPYVVS